MDSRYNYTQTEDKIYELWEKADAFNPDSVKKLRQTHSVDLKTKKSFFLS